MISWYQSYYFTQKIQEKPKPHKKNNNENTLKINEQSL